MSTPVISVKNVHKSYGQGQNRFDALRGVSFDIHQGESVAIVGKSGSGKSTLMHVLALLDAPSSGTVELEGVDTASLKGRALNQTRNKTFGFVFQQFFLTANASVLENVMLPMKIAGIPRAERRDRALAALKQLELDTKAGNKAVSDALRASHTITAMISGVAEESIAAPNGAAITTNTALTDALYQAQNTGLPAAQAERYAQASIWFSPDATEQDVTALKDRLTGAGYTGTTVEDQLGTFKTIIDAIVLVLNAFAVIALLAASFGIVNTLYMSVQERTREIGLMKAMGMGSGKVFGLFSLEAVFIGFLGSAIGVLLAMAAGTAISGALGGAFLADLPGLTLIAFEPVSTATIILIVMGIAFLAGTLSAARAARADPVTSLRYE
ncbi:ABC-type antimicrobial peptide transport system permease subunit [Paenarthrobacter nicotinovorans]|uniref:ABC-type antimicrobial peptide transport system permease subunit n=1 Tax=Paenarthrobacter nicotinovorans TaxID=29320 RepID=A0ABT9TLM1_PAENI|nr:FtsX-like permease family protein [Paenarthrobacter nicotinovorans]MDQ0102134.1 ABC-type antimicrobial peptide transport system permease subunit [Paenarthrobacter nicotinovorans]